MASSAATRIDIVANDKATEVFQRVGAEADKTASRLLGMGAATSRALKAAGMDVDTSGLGKFAQQSSYLLSQISTLRKQSTGAFSDISSGLRENISLLTQDTNAYIANTQAAIANKQARLELVTQGIADNARIIRELESDNQWRWKPEKRDLREELNRENVQLIAEQTTLTRTLTAEQKKLDTVTAAGNTRLAALKGTFKGLKDAGANFINFLGGPWVLGITAAVAVVGLLSRAESQAEKTAKEYGTTLDEIAKRYEALASGADEAADATLRASRSYQMANSQWIAGILEDVQKAREKIADLIDFAGGTDFSGDMPIQNIRGVPDAMLDSLYDLNSRLKDNKITAKEAFLEFGALRTEWEKTGIPAAFAAVLDQVGAQLDFIARNADTARKALEDLGSVQPTIGSRLQEVASRVDEELLSAYQKTTQGQREALEERKRVAQGWERLYAGTNLGSTASAVVKDAEKALQDFDKRLSKAGSSGIKAAETAISSLTSKVESLKAQLAENKGQGFLVGLEKELHRYEQAAAKASGTTREQFNAALAEARELGKQIVAEQNLDIQNQFWTEFARMTGRGWDEYIAASERALEKQAEIFRRAGIDELAIQEWIDNQKIEQARKTAAQIAIEMANKRIESGKGGFGDVLTSSLGQIVGENFNATAELSNIWGNFFTSFTQGFSNSIGQAIVMGDSLEQSLRNVGQSAISSLISGLMQLGIQWAVNAAIGQSIAAASSAATVAMGAATGAALTAAYTPAAVMASLMSFGGNSAPAIAGMTATYTAATMMSSIGSTMGSFGLGGGSYTSALAGTSSLPGMASGGYTGDYPKDKITNFVHGGEYVFSADSVDRLGLPFLEALHRGDARGFASGGYVSGGASAAAASRYSDSAFGNPAALFTGRGESGGGAPFKLIIEQRGTPQTYEVEYVTADEARIIARDEARSVVRSDSPGIVRTTFSGDMAQPNSAIAKSMSRNIKSERRR